MAHTQQFTQFGQPPRSKRLTNGTTATEREAPRQPPARMLGNHKHAPTAFVSAGLDEALPFASRLSSRSALYTELHLLLGSIDTRCSWSSTGLPGVQLNVALKALIVEDNVLAKPTGSARVKLWKELKARYILNHAHPLFRAFLSEWPRCSSEAERALTAYVLFALNDRLVMVLGVDWLFPLLRRAPTEFGAADVEAFLLHTLGAHPEVQSWSESTRRAVAQKYCSSIRDFGLAKGTSRKLTVRPALYGAPVRLLVRALRLARVAPLAVAHAPAFRLLGVDGPEVIDALGELNREGALRFRMQADVVELDVETEE